MTTIVENVNANADVNDKSRKRVMSYMPAKTVVKMDSVRGYYTRSQFMKIAVDRLIQDMTTTTMNNENNKEDGVRGANGLQPNPRNTNTSSEAQHEKPAPLITSGGSSLGS